MERSEAHAQARALHRENGGQLSGQTRRPVAWLLPSEAAATIARLSMRRIVHIDMDAFYASVEQRDNPALRGKPLAVGGQPNRRGVVAAASYEARTFGVRSAMSMAKAVRLCPSLVIVPPDFNRYRTASNAVF